MESSKSSEHVHCGTDECCMKCETAENPKDWYLISINPWFKWYFNPKTGENIQVPKEK